MKEEEFEKMLEILNEDDEVEKSFIEGVSLCTPPQKVIAMTEVIFKLENLKKKFIKEAARKQST